MSRTSSITLAAAAAFVLVLCGSTIALPLLAASTQDTCPATPTANVSGSRSGTPATAQTPAPQATGTHPPTLVQDCASDVLTRAKTW